MKATDGDERRVFGLDPMRRGFPNPLPKIDPLPGSVHVEWKRCSKNGCRCRQGYLHGPYYARRWREGVQQRKAYVRVQDLAVTLLAIEAYREAFPSVARMMARIDSFPKL